jgi:hypothetical protein
MSKNKTQDFHKQMEEAMAEVNEKFDNWIAEDIIFTPLNYRQIGEKYGLSHVYVCGVANRRGINRPRGGASPSYRQVGQ